MPSRIASWTALVGLMLAVVGLIVMVAGQRQLNDDQVRPARKYIDGRYWTIDPGMCTAFDANSKGACIALDAAKVREIQREDTNHTTLRAVGIFALVTGIGLVVAGFVGSRAPDPSGSRSRFVDREHVP